MTMNAASRLQASVNQNQNNSSQPRLSAQDDAGPSTVPTQRLAPTQRLSEVILLNILLQAVTDHPRSREYSIDRGDPQGYCHFPIWICETRS